MRKPRFNNSDSTGLLLDTVCNVFGGIILIAILVALLAQETESQIPSESINSAKVQLLQRKLDRKMAEVATLKERRSKLEQDWAKQNNPKTKPLVESLATSKQSLAAVQSEIRQSRDKLKDLLVLNSTELLKKIEQNLAAARKKIARQEAGLHVQQSKLDTLKEKEVELLAQKNAAKEQRTVRMRLPRERAITKSPVWIIVRHGKLYPTHLRSKSGSKTLNKESIKWDEGVVGDKAFPIASKGMNITDNHLEWSNYLSSIDRQDEFLSFAVWPDSFASFNIAKRQAVSLRIEYGWEPEPEDYEIVFVTTGGSIPNPQ